jgi:TPP-dependent 2-oxoacid decarboxylase
MVEYKYIRSEPLPESPAASDTKLTRTDIVRQIQGLVTSDCTIFAETGDSWFNGIRLKLPGGARFEVEIHDGPYNDIKNWDYAGLIQAFNAEDGRGLGMRVTGGGELAGAIEAASANHDGPTLIECIIDRDDCSPELISWGRQVARANARPPNPH